MLQAAIRPSESKPAELFLGRQPILNLAGKTIAYELLFRSEYSLFAQVEDDLLATSTVMVNMLSEFGLEQVIGKQLAFLNVSASLILSDTIELLPADRVVLEILEDVPISSQIIERCQDLKVMGFKLSLDDFTYRTEYDAILPLIDIVKIDVTMVPPENLPALILKVQSLSCADLLAEKVETQEQFEMCKKLGFSMFQGYYFARPDILQSKKPQANHVALMRIMGLLIGDARVNELEEPFKQSPDLSINLLKLVNSVGVSGGRRQEITSIRQAIVVLGQRQLLRWVQLLLYVAPDSGTSTSLMQQVAFRARMMELIATKMQNVEPRFSDQAFMVGMLSLVDVILKAPIASVLNEIGLAQHLKDAILKQEGALGQLLRLAKEIEMANFAAARNELMTLGITPTDFVNIQLEAMHWTTELNQQPLE